MTHIGSNYLLRGNADEILGKYRDLLRKFIDQMENVAICSILPRYDVDCLGKLQL